MVLALAMPVKKRVQNNMKELTAKPEARTNAPNSRLETPTMGTRLIRSASHPIGTAPRTKKAADAVPMKTMAPSLMWKVRWISGARTLMAAPSSSSSETMAVRIRNMNQPPMRRPWRKRHRRRRDTGEEVVGEDDLLAGVLLCGLPGGLGRQHRPAARDAAEPCSFARVGPRVPLPGPIERGTIVAVGAAAMVDPQRSTR